MASVQQWISAARPFTLPAAAAPVLVGSAGAGYVGSFRPAAAVLALGLALGLQVGVNYANDYSDGVRGTDLERVGPTRLTAAGLASPSAVKRAAVGSLLVAAVVGLALVAYCGQWWLLGVGALALVAAWTYTGGKNPYGYRGLGEVGVFIFFGLVATAGTTYTQAGQVPWPVWSAAIGIGLIACGILMVNNIRDIPTDTISGKRTLAVRLGECKARWSYAGMLVGAVVCALVGIFATWWALLLAVLLGPAVALGVLVISGLRGPGLVRVLKFTGQFELAFALLWALAFVLGGR